MHHSMRIILTPVACTAIMVHAAPGNGFKDSLSCLQGPTCTRGRGQLFAATTTASSPRQISTTSLASVRTASWTSRQQQARLRSAAACLISAEKWSILKPNVITQCSWQSLAAHKLLLLQGDGVWVSTPATSLLICLALSLANILSSSVSLCEMNISSYLSSLVLDYLRETY